MLNAQCSRLDSSTTLPTIEEERWSSINTVTRDSWIAIGRTIEWRSGAEEASASRNHLELSLETRDFDRTRQRQEERSHVRHRLLQSSTTARSHRTLHQLMEEQFTLSNHPVLLLSRVISSAYLSLFLNRSSITIIERERKRANKRKTIEIEIEQES